MIKMSIKELIQKRTELKRKKPNFIRQDSHKKRRLEQIWRRPRGSGSKMRINLKGYHRKLQVGWGSPCEVKGFEKNGLKPVIVNNVEDLNIIDPKTETAVISSGVGNKKKMAIVEAAVQKKITISNVKHPDKFMTEMKAQFEGKKKEKLKIKEEREKKKEAIKKESEKKKAKEDDKKKQEATTEEEKKTEEKKEKDKMLISTQ